MSPCVCLLLGSDFMNGCLRAGWLGMLRAALVPRASGSTWGCSGGSLVKWCRVGKQVGFGCDFTTASDVTQVSSAFFFSGLETLRLNWGVARVDGCPRLLRTAQDPGGFWTSKLGKWEWSLCSRRDGTVMHCSLVPHHLWGWAAGWVPQRAPTTPNLLLRLFPSRGWWWLLQLLYNWGCANRLEGNTQNQCFINTFFPSVHR